MKKYQKYIFYFENSFPVYNWVQRLFCIKAWNLIAGGEIVHCIKKNLLCDIFKANKIYSPVSEWIELPENILYLCLLSCCNNNNKMVQEWSM